MEDLEVENAILSKLSRFDATWSNLVHRKLRVNKANYTRIRDKMIEEGWIKAEKKKNRLLLTISTFEGPTYPEHDWTRIARINCETFLKYLKDRKPLFTITKKKKINIRKNKKDALDVFFHELDRQMIVHTRLVNADALGLIQSPRAKYHQKNCVEFVHEFIKKLLNDHKEFKKEIREYAQSQVRTVQFKI